MANIKNGTRAILLLLSCFAVFCTIALFSYSDALADSKLCPKHLSARNDIEPHLLDDANSGIVGAGADIITAVFTAVNAIMMDIARQFFEGPDGKSGIINNPDYIAAVNATVLLYIIVYGIMIMFNIASYRAGEIVNRLFKIAVVWALMTQGWTFFNQWVGTPLIQGLNDLIQQFSAAATGASVQATDSSGNLQSASMSALMGPMTLVFSSTFVIMLFTMIMAGLFGIFFFLLLVWGIFEFLFMIIGALITYIKAIVGLSFLFGLAPIFFVFILFEKTKQIFMGWVNQVMGFFVQPVLLFAFLGFYSVLLKNVLMNIIFPPGVDYCYCDLVNFLFIHIQWWRPVTSYVACGADWVGPPPINVIDILYFLLLTHLGKNLSNFIESLARDLSSGSGAGMVKGGDIGKWASNTFAGGRGPVMAAVDGTKWGAKKIGGVFGGGKGGSEETVKRPGLNDKQNERAPNSSGSNTQQSSGENSRYGSGQPSTQRSSPTGNQGSSGANRGSQDGKSTSAPSPTNPKGGGSDNGGSTPPNVGKR